MRKIVGAFVSKRATQSPKEAHTYAHDWGKATGTVRQTTDGFTIGKRTRRSVEVSQDLTVFVE